MSQIAPLRITPEDLEGLDNKTREGLQPLLDALNIFAQETVAAAAAQTGEQLVPVTLVTQATVADSFPLVFRHAVARPTWVGMVCNPKDPDHTLAAPFVMQGFQLTDNGLVSVPWITGLLPSSTYFLTFLIR